MKATHTHTQLHTDLLNKIFNLTTTTNIQSKKAKKTLDDDEIIDKMKQTNKILSVNLVRRTTQNSIIVSLIKQNKQSKQVNN